MTTSERNPVIPRPTGRRRPRARARFLAAVPLLAASVLTGVPTAHAAASDDIRVNEVVTTGGVDDSIELFNKGAASVDVSGWVLKDSDKDHTYEIPSGTVLAPGGHRAFDVHDAFGLGSDDQARLYLADGRTLVDSFSWSTHSSPSWSRCPDGTGDFGRAAAVTLGGRNACGTDGGDDGSTTPVAWPGGSGVATADGSDVFGEDLSGLHQEGGVLWGGAEQRQAVASGA